MHIIGTEIEYGIVAVDQPDASPIETSTQAVVAYAQASGLGINRRTRWDYHNESPLRDIRGSICVATVPTPRLPWIPTPWVPPT